MTKNTIKRILIWADNRFKTSVYKRASNLLESWYGSNFLNAIRRSINPTIAKWKYKVGIREKYPLKLHLGCGNRHFDGYVNIDLRKTRATDLVCDIRKLPYPDNSVKLIETYHVIEHLPRHDLPKALKEWHRVLVSGGKLIVECPDFDKNVRDYLKGNDPDIQLLYIFGRQRFLGDAHYFGYNFKRLKDVLEKCGFTNVKRKSAQDLHITEAACLRIECNK